nr:hypothetical protein [Nitrosomonas nitrosa]
MAVRSLAETRARASDLRPLQKWLRGWRAAAIGIVVIGAAATMSLVWNWLNSGHALVLLVIAGPGLLAWLFWSLLSDKRRDRNVTELPEVSDWEVKIRPQFPSDEQTKIKSKH